MNQNVQFQGCAAIPSDYVCPDTDLSLAVNLIPEDGALRPVMPPRAISPAFSTSLIIHKVPGDKTNIIGLEGRSLQWAPFNPDPDAAVSILASSGIAVLPEGCQVIDANVIGNILLIATSLGVRYFYWRPDHSDYLDLGTHIPDIPLEFGLFKYPSATSPDLTVTVDIRDDGKTASLIAELFAGGGNRPLHNHEEAIHDITQPIMAYVNKYVAETLENGRFLMPFFVRYAIRLFDGSHVMSSAPVLMIPNSACPLMKISKISNDGKSYMELALKFTPALLKWRLIEDPGLQPWKDIIAGIDIFVSPQIYTYTQDGADVQIAHRTSSSESAFFTHIGTPTDNAEKTFSEAQLLLPRKEKAAIASDITSSALFYRIASLDFDDIKPSTAFVDVAIEKKDLNNISVLPRLEDEIYAHHQLVPSCLFPYNSRLSIADIQMRLFPSFPIRCMAQFTAVSATSKPVSVYVCLKKEGNLFWTRLPAGSSPLHSFAPLSSSFPRWLFYPDSSAVEMIIAVSDGYWRLPLTSHDLMEGSYWFRGLDAAAPSMIAGEIPSEISSADFQSVVSLRNRVAVSEPNNPFRFAITSFTSVGNSRILKITSAARPLSQGQFGAFPLYAFTLDGIWALEVSTSGSYSARQPISRDVCLNPASVTQLDSAVAFTTSRGLMILSGSQIQPITDSIITEHPFKISALPGFSKLLAPFSKLKNTDIRLPAPFSEFLIDCGIIYDYTHQRLVLYNPSLSYAYIYSLKSRLWGMAESSIVSHLNGYPDAIACDVDGNIVSLSSPQSKSVKTLLLSRPMKLGGSDILKTISELLVRGDFRRSHVSCALFGSRDLIHWHLISSSTIPILRGFRGSPYKYFRLAVTSTLDPQESLSSVSITLEPRRTNRLR